jgi:hypothetical protein
MNSSGQSNSHSQLATAVLFVLVCESQGALLLIQPRGGTIENTAFSIVAKACLPRRGLEIDVLLFRAFSSAGMCLASRCLVMGIHVTIHTN